MRRQQPGRQIEVPRDDPLWREKTESIERIYLKNRTWKGRLGGGEGVRREKRDKREERAESVPNIREPLPL